MVCSSQAMSAVLRREVAEPEPVLVQSVVNGQPAVRESQAHGHGTGRQVVAGPLEKLYRLKPLPAPGSQHGGDIIAPPQLEAVRCRPLRPPGHVDRIPRDRQIVELLVVDFQAFSCEVEHHRAVSEPLVVAVIPHQPSRGQPATDKALQPVTVTVGDLVDPVEPTRLVTSDTKVERHRGIVPDACAFA